jgi:hypothetical protein
LDLNFKIDFYEFFMACMLAISVVYVVVNPPPKDLPFEPAQQPATTPTKKHKAAPHTERPAKYFPPEGPLETVKAENGDDDRKVRQRF